MLHTACQKAPCKRRFLFLLGHLLRFGAGIIEDAEPPKGGGSLVLADCHAMCLRFFNAATSARYMPAHLTCRSPSPCFLLR